MFNQSILQHFHVMKLGCTVRTLETVTGLASARMPPEILASGGQLSGAWLWAWGWWAVLTTFSQRLLEQL